MVSAKHGVRSRWSTNVSTAPYGVGPWKSIAKLWDNFNQQCSYKAGNGIHIKFWKDKWLGNTTLQSDFPTLFSIASEPDSTISQNRENNAWTPLFRRNFQDWELNSLLQLLSKLECYSPVVHSPDRIKWDRRTDGQYTVKAGYSSWCAQNDMIEMWPWKLIWRTKAPPKVLCFVWTALHEACLTQDNRWKRGRITVNRCFMCQQAYETNRHLFLHCPVTNEVWFLFFAIFGVSWVMPASIKDAYISWNSWKVDKSIKQVWKMIPTSIFWCVWKERNKRCFDGISTSIQQLKTNCLLTLYSWDRLAPLDSNANLMDFVSSLVIA